MFVVDVKDRSDRDVETTVYGQAIECPHCGGRSLDGDGDRAPGGIAIVRCRQCGFNSKVDMRGRQREWLRDHVGELMARDDLRRLD